MLKRLRKAVIMVTFAAVLAVSVLGTATLTQVLTGHTPTAHADKPYGYGDDYGELEVWCYAKNYPSNDNAQYVQVTGQDQFGWDTQGAYMEFTPAGPGGPANTAVYIHNYYWTGTVSVTFWDGWGDSWEEQVWIDPGQVANYGFMIWGC